ncbi:MAG: hypothetical protein GY713_11065 [Actinomycetia bacterium]|nr:hypothetical protein [Actinomycetes bacterium]
MTLASLPASHLHYRSPQRTGSPLQRTAIPVTTVSPTPPPAPAEPLDLRDVIKVVPAHCRQSNPTRSWGLVARDVVVWIASLVGLALTDTWWLVVPLWALAGLAVSAMFVIAHDATHQALFPDRKTNDRVARWLMVPSQHIKQSWALGHNHIHHNHTARQGMDFVWHPVSPTEYQAMGRIGRLRHRLEWSMLGAGVYYMRAVWWEKMVRLTEPPAKWVDSIGSDRKWLARVTTVIVVAMSALGWAMYGNPMGSVWLVFKLLVVPMVLFMWVIGFTVYLHHISPDLRWATRRGWTKVRGQLDSTTVLRVPILVRPFFHSIFIHVPHHVDPRIPCYHLDEAARHIADAFPGRVVDEKLTLPRYLANTRACKLYDFDTQEWSTY